VPGFEETHEQQKHQHEQHARDPAAREVRQHERTAVALRVDRRRRGSTAASSRVLLAE
jgi:hypothetical protein